MHYNPIIHDYSKDYLTFVALGNTTFSFTNTISYSSDNGQNWTEGNSVTVNGGDKVLWKGELTPFSNNGIGTFSSTGQFDVQGNIMSLLYGDDFDGQTDLTGKNYAFYNLFRGNDKLINAKNLILPATTLATQCYEYMFGECENLISAPVLPAETMARECYYGMFYYCESLKTAPELPATTLVDSCYYDMFRGCTSLNSITCLATNKSASNCTSNWVYDVPSGGTFTKADGASWSTGTSGIPSGWTVETATE